MVLLAGARRVPRRRLHRRILDRAPGPRDDPHRGHPGLRRKPRRLQGHERAFRGGRVLRDGARGAEELGAGKEATARQRHAFRTDEERSNPERA